MPFFKFYAVQLHLSFPFPFSWSSSLPYYIRLHAVLQQPDSELEERDSIFGHSCDLRGFVRREGGIICYAMHMHMHMHMQCICFERNASSVLRV